MKKLSELYKCNLDININGIKNNSNEVEKGDLFVCTKGVNFDRHDFIEDAIKRGCSALVVKEEGNYKVPFIKVNNPNKELGRISKRFYDNPLRKIKLIGVTGTDGKTTTASIIRNMLGNNICGYIGTNGVYLKDKIISTNNTTPEINKTYKYLYEFNKNNLKYSTMEISSEALLLDRVNTLKLEVAILTNITEDHLNVHKSINNYIKSKQKIFSHLKPNGIAIINADDNHYEYIREGIKNKVLTFGKKDFCTLQIKDIKELEDKTIFTFSYLDKIYNIKTTLKGEYNIYNLSAAILCLTALGFSIEDIIDRVGKIEIVDGRCEFLEYGQDYKIVLDYAHTENGLKSVLSYLNKIKKSRIITVTGSAGGREKEKRCKMGKVVLDLSDLVIFTMDDPRYEDVNAIIDEMIGNSNKNNYIRILDRKEAIKKALSIAEKDDIVLITGKGRDNYMAINDEKVDYNDFYEIKKYFK